MITEKQHELQILTDGESQDTIGMSLDLDSANMLMQMLSKNLYSDGIGSSIRETASNALDSHRRAGVDDPIIVSFCRNKEHNYEYTVEDFGTGLDDKDVEYIISKYGKSTKRLEANELGMFGLGFKAPLAYSSSFYFVCRKDGMERKYMMYEGDDFNKIDLLHETETTERNGVKVIIPVKWGDRYEFIKKTKEQLAYFEGVYFNFQNVGDTIDNNFKIFRSKEFQISELTDDHSLHICLDNVYYPIDFQKLGIPKLDLQIGLRFGLTDGLFPTPNREAIRYTQEAKKVILDKIEKFSDYMVTSFNTNMKETDDVKAIFRYYNARRKYIMIEEKDYDITSLIDKSTVKLIKPKMKGITLLDLEHLAKHNEYMFKEYEKKYILQNDRFSANKGNWNTQVGVDTFNDSFSAIYLYSEKIGVNKKNYVKTLHPTNGYTKRVAFIKKTMEFGLKGKKDKTGLKLFRSNHIDTYDNYIKILELKNYKKADWRKVIEEFKFVLSLFFKDIKNLDDLVVPQSWLDARKKKTKKVYSNVSGGVTQLKLEGEIICKKAEDLLRYVDGKNAKFTPDRYHLEKIYREPKLIVYAEHGSQDKLDRLYHISKKQKMAYITLSQREMNVVKDLEIHNFIPIEKFMEGKNKPFRRLVTGALITRLKRKYRNVFNKREKLKSVCKDLMDKLDLISQYENNQIEVRHDNMYDALIEVANTHNLYDETIYPEYLECKAILESLPFLEPFMDVTSHYLNEEDPLLDALTDLFKYYKYKVNFERYHMRLNEDLPLEETLTEETVEELVKIN